MNEVPLYPPFRARTLATAKESWSNPVLDQCTQSDTRVTRVKTTSSSFHELPLRQNHDRNRARHIMKPSQLGVILHVNKILPHIIYCLGGEHLPSFGLCGQILDTARNRPPPWDHPMPLHCRHRASVGT